MGDDNYGGANPYKLYTVDHHEEGKEKYISDVGNTVSHRCDESICNLERIHIHHLQAGEGSAVGGFKTNH